MRFVRVLWLVGLVVPVWAWAQGVTPSPSPTPVASPLPAPTATASAAREFGVPAKLKVNVDFWTRIYSQYATHQGLIHDAKYIDHVYEVLDFKDRDGSHTRQIRAAKRKWKAVLMSVHRKQARPESLNEDEKKVFELFNDVNEPNKFMNAAHRKRLHFQLGQRDRFEEGLRASGMYLARMEEIFRKEGLPTELTRLPFVESSFNIRARSKVGASGVWQFMRSTGRFFLRINEAVDERNDPILATEAAARLLKLNYESLGSWPLAVTAYNHGRQGMMRAVRRVGSEDLGDLVDEYRSRSFGFASSNFYACLLAAIEVERNALRYFGKTERLRAPEYLEMELPEAIRLTDLGRFLGLDVAGTRALNPAWSEAVLAGRRPIPAGYRLRIPHDGKTGKEAAVQVFLAGYREIPSTFKTKGSPSRKFKKSRRP